LYFLIFFLLLLSPPSSTLFPYTTLFRSDVTRASTDIRELAQSIRPEVFCFATPPQVRLELVRLGIECGAKLIAYEKPIALSMNEDRKSTRLNSSHVAISYAVFCLKKKKK